MNLEEASGNQGYRTLKLLWLGASQPQLDASVRSTFNRNGFNKKAYSSSKETMMPFATMSATASYRILSSLGDLQCQAIFTRLDVD
ncbi:hypothetical protein GOP47_0025819 [Adiantum capillus-veneris]|uniref:Uncharacterized protein n=1 Tax=Adiantum capillus-veneris TaxID=13818 RepID=A0A9D4Z383_ADICA|nr:hypothetical protein GOP47_0025819 [Adiantum capillus-veneris]